MADTSEHLITMSDFAESYLGKLRQLVGNRLLMVLGTRIFIEDGRRRLLMQHRRDFDAWGFPGGNAEQGEPLPDCITREVREETGIEIASPVPIALSSDPRIETVTFPNGDLCQSYVLMFWTRTFSGDAKVLDDESLAFEWFGPDDFPPMSPTMQRGLEALRRYQATGAFQLI